MDTFKEFRAKTVDQAIDDACRFYAVDREALEIDILSGGSAGIFGLGAKKAAIRAKRRRMSQEQPEIMAPAATEEALIETPVAQPAVAAGSATISPLDETTEPVVDAVDEEDFDDEDELSAPVSLTAEEKVRLEAHIREMMMALLKPINPAAVLTINVSAAPVHVHIDDDENSGLIIGRDGQTITALQYLANRIISKSWPQSPRIQLDAGDYRQKQEEQLMSVALFLSEKAKKSGRVQSTKPLSSFHRRVVHMALQNDQAVQTRSKGEGHMKRVLILPVKRSKSAGRPPRRHESSPRCQS